jgi:hypothetical protein
MAGRGRAALAWVGYGLLALLFVAWVLSAVLVLHPWYIREVGG